MRNPSCHSTWLAITLLASGLIGASPAGPDASTADPLAPLAAKVAEKSSGRSVVLVIRPDASGSPETPTAVRGIRASVLHELQSSNLNIATSDPADAVLRDAITAGVPTAAEIAPVLAAAKTDLVLCGAVHRAGDSHKIAFTLMDGHAPMVQLSVVMPGKSIETTGDDVDLASAAISQAIASTVGKAADPIQAADIKTLMLSIAPKSSADTATAGFEATVFDAVAHALRDKNIHVQPLVGTIGSATLQPALVAKLKDLPADSAVMQLSYTRRPGGMLVAIAIVSAKEKLATESVGLNSWDVAAMPAFPVLNTRVLAYSDAQKGDKVGNGECWTLAAEALKSARAKPADGYTFGRKLAAGEKIFPGDIMQFTEARFEGKSNKGTWWVTLGNPHHTAVVRTVLGPTKYEILEQNPGPVKAATIDFKDLKSGTWEAWRPEAK